MLDERFQKILIPTALLVVFLSAPSRADLEAYNQDFEGLDPDDPSALAEDGWFAFGNVFDEDGNFRYSFGNGPAPNGGPAFSAIVTGEGGPPQGAQQFSIYNAYDCCNPPNDGHFNGTDLVEANVYQEQIIGVADLGARWTFEFDAKLGDLLAPTTALAFIKTIDPNSGYALTNFVSGDMTAIPASWDRYSISLDMVPGLEGQIIQFGFANTTSNFIASNVFYDNISFAGDVSSNAGPDALPSTHVLHPAVPNPFNPRTRLSFELGHQAQVKLSVYDVSGRLIRHLLNEVRPAGRHSVHWAGTNEAGMPVGSGVYLCRLEVESVTTARRLVLLKLGATERLRTSPIWFVPAG